MRPELTVNREHVRLNIVRLSKLSEDLKRLREAVTAVEQTLDEMREESDPLAVHIFISRRRYRRTTDSKGGKRHQQAVESTYYPACDLGFRGSFDEWRKLLGGTPGRD